jgi:hypothetical protein
MSYGKKEPDIMEYALIAGFLAVGIGLVAPIVQDFLFPFKPPANAVKMDDGKYYTCNVGRYGVKVCTPVPGQH